MTKQDIKHIAISITILIILCLLTNYLNLPSICID